MTERPAWICAEAAADAAGTLLARHLKQVYRESGAPRLAIPGGSALDAVAAMRRELAAEREVWAHTRLTWVDERCVPAADRESNRGEAKRRGLLGDPDPADRLPLYRDGESGPQAVARVEAALASRFVNGLDVVLLGMGEDGHVASLFPGCTQPSAGCVLHVTASPKPPPERVTLTRAFLATACHTVLLAVGDAKRGALQRLFDGDPALPAHGLPGLTVVTDHAVSSGAGGVS